jgi:hypothetical protein
VLLIYRKIAAWNCCAGNLGGNPITPLAEIAASAYLRMLPSAQPEGAGRA